MVGSLDYWNEEIDGKVNVASRRGSRARPSSRLPTSRRLPGLHTGDDGAGCADLPEPQ